MWNGMKGSGTVEGCMVGSWDIAWWQRYWLVMLWDWDFREIVKRIDVEAKNVVFFNPSPSFFLNLFLSGFLGLPLQLKFLSTSFHSIKMPISQK
jgi:hypothetical protein